MNQKKQLQPVSVIICARNEAENLKNFLPSVLEQDYPDFEVIVVNDCSEDNSYDILGKFLETISASENFNNKQRSKIYS